MVVSLIHGFRGASTRRGAVFCKQFMAMHCMWSICECSGVVSGGCVARYVAIISGKVRLKAFLSSSLKNLLWSAFCRLGVVGGEWFKTNVADTGRLACGHSLEGGVVVDVGVVVVPCGDLVVEVGIRDGCHGACSSRVETWFEYLVSVTNCPMLGWCSWALPIRALRQAVESEGVPPLGSHGWGRVR
eukprot:6481656-Amphidinium_carterae.3